MCLLRSLNEFVKQLNKECLNREITSIGKVLCALGKNGKKKD